MVVLIELLNVFKLPVVVSIESTRFFAPIVVVAIELDRDPIEELNSLVVVATLEDKPPILVDTDELNELIVELIELDILPILLVKEELKLVIVLVSPLVVIAIEEDKLPTLELKSDVVVATDDDREPILELNPDVVVATDDDKLPIEELSPLVIVANELDKEPIEDVKDELTLVMVLVNPDVVVAILELNDVFPPNNELILADTDELNDCKSIPSTLPVKSIEPLTITASPNTILLPPDEVILKPSCICVVPLIDIIPFVGSNNISPPPDDFNSISPSADCNIIESEPASNILSD